MTEIKTPQDHRVGKKNPVLRTAYISNDPEFEAQYQEVNTELEWLKYRIGMPDTSEEQRSRYDELKAIEASMRKDYREHHSIKFVFRSIGMKKWDQLLKDHPATDENRELVKSIGQNPDQLRYNPETFHPALLQAALVEPAGWDMVEIYGSPDWNEGELGALVEAAVGANQSRQIVPLGNA